MKGAERRRRRVTCGWLGGWLGACCWEVARSFLVQPAGAGQCWEHDQRVGPCFLQWFPWSLAPNLGWNTQLGGDSITLITFGKHVRHGLHMYGKFREHRRVYLYASGENYSCIYTNYIKTQEMAEPNILGSNFEGVQRKRCGESISFLPIYGFFFHDLATCTYNARDLSYLLAEFVAGLVIGHPRTVWGGIVVWDLHLN